MYIYIYINKYIYIYIFIYIYNWSTSDPRQTECSNLTEDDENNAIMKTMRPSDYHHIGFVAAHAHGNMTCVYTLPVRMTQRILNKLSKEHNN